MYSIYFLGNITLWKVSLLLNCTLMQDRSKSNLWCSWFLFCSRLMTLYEYRLTDWFVCAFSVSFTCITLTYRQLIWAANCLCVALRDGVMNGTISAHEIACYNKPTNNACLWLFSTRVNFIFHLWADSVEMVLSRILFYIRFIIITYNFMFIGRILRQNPDFSSIFFKTWSMVTWKWLTAYTIPTDM